MARRLRRMSGMFGDFPSKDDLDRLRADLDADLSKLSPHLHDCPWWINEPCTCAERSIDEVIAKLERPEDD